MKRNVAIRLGGEGAPEVKRMFDDIATSGDASAQRMVRSWERAGQDVEASIKRRADAAAKLEMAYGGITPANVERFAGNNNEPGKSAQQSALVFNQAYSQMEDRARALVLAINPAAAAQDRFNREMGEARALVSQGVLSLDDYVEKLRHEQAALDAVSDAQKRGGVTAGAHRQAMIGASYQVQDFFTQVSMGANPMNAFAVQGAQLAGQFANIEGKAGNVARFFMGPWGMAITGAMLVGSMFTKGLFEQGETLDDLVAKLKDEQAQRGRNETAQRMFGSTLEGVTAAIREQREELDKLSDAHKTAAERMVDVRLQTIASAIETRKKTAADAAAAAALAEQAEIGARATGDMSMLAKLQNDATKAREDAAAAENAYQEALREGIVARNELLTEQTRMMSDDAARIAQSYEKRIRAIVDEDNARIRAGHRARADSQARIAQLEKERKAELDAVAERNRRQSTPSLGSQLNAERSQQLLATAQRFSGLSENRAGDRSTLRALFSEANQNIDPKMVAWCAAFVNAVLATNGLPGTDSLAARSFLNYGTATNKPQQGDIVVLRRGNNQAQGHVGFYAGEGRNGQIMVTGGNQGDAVSTAAFNRRDVLGFRRAPTEAATFKDEAREVAERERELARLLERYDPLTAAATRYREEIDKINKALARSEIDEATAERYRAGAKRALDTETNRITGTDTAVQNALKIMDQIRKAEQQREKARADGIAQMLRGQSESLALAEGELSLAAANDNVREQSLSKLRLILDLKRLGVDADTAEGRQILTNHDALDRIYQQIERQRAAWDEVRGFGMEFVETVLSPSTWDDWGEGGKRVLDMLKSEFIKLALLNPIRNWMNGDDALPTAGNLLGRLFGGGGVPVADNSAVYAAFAAQLPRSASGTHHSSGGAMLLGEFGPEIAWLPRGSGVSTANDTRRLLAANDRAPAGPTINVYADRAVLADEVRTWVADGMALAAAQGAAGGAMMGEAQMAASQAKKLGRSWG